VVLLAGSGPTDRDGNTVGGYKNDNLRMLAEGLAHRGVASLRYDRRGIAESRAAQPTAAGFTFPMLVDDAALWIAELRNGSRFPVQVIAGHSEGSLAAILAAQRAPVDALVTLAGPGRPHSRGIRDQLASTLPSAERATLDSLLAGLVAGRADVEVPSSLSSIFPPSALGYLASLYQYNPAAELAKVRIPALIIQGTTDLQVPNSDADSLARAKPDAKVVRFVGVNHLLKRASGPAAAQWQSYTDPTVPVAPEVVDTIAAFICSLQPGVTRR
jgi:pimeloyl-ACP methyl ester carboxylesterase